jgi:hypothetical protein
MKAKTALVRRMKKEEVEDPVTHRQNRVGGTSILDKKMNSTSRLGAGAGMLVSGSLLWLVSFSVDWVVTGSGGARQGEGFFWVLLGPALALLFAGWISIEPLRQSLATGMDRAFRIHVVAAAFIVVGIVLGALFPTLWQLTRTLVVLGSAALVVAAVSLGFALLHRRSRYRSALMFLALGWAGIAVRLAFDFDVGFGGFLLIVPFGIAWMWLGRLTFAEST